MNEPRKVVIDKKAHMSKDTNVSLNKMVDLAHEFLSYPLAHIHLWACRYEKEAAGLLSGITDDPTYIEFTDRMIHHSAPEELKAVAYLWAKDNMDEAE